ncbi:MAG: PAS domain S-box protein [Caldilineaceae bacterium]
MPTNPTEAHPQGDVQPNKAQLLTEIDEIFWEADVDTLQFTYVSEQAEQLLGYPLAQWFMPNFWVDHLYAADREWVPAFCARAIREKRNHSIEYRMVAADGRLVWLRDMARVVVEDGFPSKLSGTILDITTHKQAAAALQERETLLQKLQQLAGIGSFTHDFTTGRLTHSAQMRAIFGLEQNGELTFAHFLALVHPEDQAAVQNQLTTIFQSDVTSFRLEYRVLPPGRSLRHVQVVGSIERDDAAQPVRVLGVTQDITEQKRAAEERQAHLWFLESMDKVNRAIQAAHDLEQMLGDVLDAVLEIFACDRAWLLYPCDPETTTWHVPMERTRPEYPGAFAAKIEIPIQAEMIRVFEIMQAASAPVHFGPGAEHPLPPETADQHTIQSAIALTVDPKIDKLYVFGLHQCSYPRVWTAQEERLFQEIGRRLGDALTSLLTYRHLQESELRYREVFENTSDTIVIAAVTEEGRFRFLDMNPAWEQVMGIRHTALIGQFFEDFSTNEIAHSVLADFRVCYEQKAPLTFEREFVTPTGRWCMQVTLIPVSDGAGRIYRLVGIGHNVTAQKQAEANLRASEARFRAFLDHATDAFFVHDDRGAIVDVNRHACESLGYTREELVGKTPFDIDAEMKIDFLRQIGARLISGEIVTFETRHRRKNGTLFPVEVRMRAFDEGGEQLGVALVQDITARKQAERALVESHSLLQAVVEGTTDIIFVKDRQGRYLIVQCGLCELVW